MGTGFMTHDIESNTTINQADTTQVGTPPITLLMPILDGYYTTTSTFLHRTNNQGGTTLSQDAGAPSPALGNMTFDRGHFTTSSHTHSLDRAAGSETWTPSGSTSHETGNHDDFFSTLRGDWTEPGDNTFSPIVGTFNHTIINNNTNKHKTSGPLISGGYDITTTVTTNHDHQNLSTHNGVGTYTTIDHDVPINGIVQVSRQADTVDTQNLTTTTSPTGIRSQIGSGTKKTVSNSSRTVTGSGTMSWNQTVVTPYLVGQSSNHTWWNRTIDQGFVSINNNTDEYTYGIFQNEYTLLSESHSGYRQHDSHSVLDFSGGNNEVWDFEIASGHIPENTEKTGTANHTWSSLSKIVSTDNLTTSSSVNYLIAGSNMQSRSGSSTHDKLYEYEMESFWDDEVINGVLPNPGYHNQWVRVDVTIDRFSDNKTRHQVQTEVIYGATPADNIGSTTYSGESWEGQESDDTISLWEYTPVPYYRVYSQEPYNVTIDLNDDSGTLPTYFWLFHDIETAFAPFNTAAPSVVAPGPSSEAELVDLALDQLIYELESGPQFYATPNNATPPTINPGIDAVTMNAAESQVGTATENTKSSTTTDVCYDCHPDAEPASGFSLSDFYYGNFPQDTTIDDLIATLGIGEYELSGLHSTPLRYGLGKTFTIRAQDGSVYYVVPAFRYNDSTGTLQQVGYTSYTNQAEADAAIAKLEWISWYIPAGKLIITGGNYVLAASVLRGFPSNMGFQGSGAWRRSGANLLDDVASTTPKWAVPGSVQSKFPSSWTSAANKKKVGSRWFDPANPKANGVRIDQGTPGHPLVSQQVDHVIVRRNGQLIGRDGQPIMGNIADNAANAHIPLSEYLNWRNWYAP
jgi:hypothetical protein